jgi:hypothetical protein
MAKHTVKVDLNLIENFKIEGKAGNHTVFIDQPKNVKGTDTGPNPSEYFLLSLGGCIITIARMAARQKRIKLNDFKLQVEVLLGTGIRIGELEALEPIYQAGTLSGNPVAVAAGIATLKKISQPDFYKNLLDKAEHLEKELGLLAEKHGVAAVTNRTGLYVGYIPGLPGAHSQGETLDELNKNLQEVVATGWHAIRPTDTRS